MLIAIGIIALIVTLFASMHQDDDVKSDAYYAHKAAKDEYERCLENLMKHPDEPAYRILALEKGRVFYQIEIPDTQTVNGHGRVVAIQNNSANREARINADIEARVGHLRSHQPKMELAQTKDQQLAGLKKCYESGVLAKDEYERLVSFIHQTNEAA